MSYILVLNPLSVHFCRWQNESQMWKPNFPNLAYQGDCPLLTVNFGHLCMKLFEVYAKLHCSYFYFVVLQNLCASYVYFLLCQDYLAFQGVLRFHVYLGLFSTIMNNINRAFKLKILCMHLICFTHIQLQLLQQFLPYFSPNFLYF